MKSFSAIVIGDESLLVSCSEIWLAHGHTLTAVVCRDPAIADWAAQHGVTVVQKPGDLTEAHAADWLFSIANLQLIPEAILALGRDGAVNFHDGPLPAYAGLNAPVWAILNGETAFGVSWHMMEAGVDRGDLLAQHRFEVTPDDTAFSLNAKCYAAGIESFETVLNGIESGAPDAQPQDVSQRSYFARDDRPDAGGRLNPAQPCAALMGLIRAMDFGTYWNPLVRPKLDIGTDLLAVTGGEALGTTEAAPGTVLARGDGTLDLACADGALRLTGLSDLAGNPADLPEVGTALPVFSAQDDATLRDAYQAIASEDRFWRAHLADPNPLRLHGAARVGTAPDWASLPVTLGAHPLPATLLWAGISTASETAADIAVAPAPLQEAAATAPRHFADWAPLHLPALEATCADLRRQASEQFERIAQAQSFARDLILRDPELSALDTPDIAFVEGEAPLEGSLICITPETGLMHYDASRIDAGFARILADRLSHIAAWLADAPEDASADRCPLPAAEHAQMATWNATETAYDRVLTVPAAIAAQVARTPDATAIVFEDQTITYAALNARADAIAAALTRMEVTRGAHVGLYCRRSIDMVAAAIGIMKAGAAYIPLDPAYPADRIAHYIRDSETRVIVTQTEIAGDLPPGDARHLILEEVATSAPTLHNGPEAEDTAYLIYTSGSTGLPKGVMVSHRNVINFFAGMDAEVDPALGTTWGAVTSMAFDISVLELFYTLARGFKVVLMGDENRAAVSNGPIRLPGKKIDFNLFYWGNDDGVGRDRYALLLDGAKFADAHGFNAIWTPERHFHAFGGPYPNPSVTGAAVAAVTRNLSVRAGSCVAPLHHTARIAEEWAVIDNLTNGRAGLAIASGWQPDDFVLRPENTPPENKPAMYRAIEDLRKLWRGDTVEFPKADGTPHAVMTQPRPVSPELPIWVTTAGNPATWREAGEIGANVLTHLLGQSIDEVGEKIAIYHDALRRAGHDPDDFQVTLMLHTYLAADRETARDVARGPMKDYLRSAAGLIKQYAWAFPAFKRPAGMTNAFEMDLGSLDGEELEAILDFAFERYFEDSGLFGTIEDALTRVEQVKRIGVTEVACLIDYGIPVPQVMEGLKPLAQVLKAANAPVELAEDDFSLAAQLVRHHVSHLQCTPSMAQIIAMNDEARLALSGVKQMMIGGEALPGTLVRDLRRATRARITNMYGPTETTIWSSVERVQDDSAAVIPIGAPIANTSLHILDAHQRPVPLGVPGELCIGGDGVTPGYWQRPDLIADRFITYDGARLYRTGDLVCLRADGVIDFLGRNDNQVKIRGQRIELGEIEAVITEMSFVAQAVVIDRKMSGGDTGLAGYFTVSGTADETALRDHLTARLPQIMVPATLTELERFPLTPNRKVDRKALPDPQPARPTLVATPGPQAEQVGTARQIAEIWMRILGVPQIGPDDNFFGLGGHSLLAVQAHREIKTELGRSDISITDIFRFPTLSGLARHIDGGDAVEEAAPAIPMPSRGDVMSKRKAMRANRGARAG